MVKEHPNLPFFQFNRNVLFWCVAILFWVLLIVLSIVMFYCSSLYLPGGWATYNRSCWCWQNALWSQMHADAASCRASTHKNNKLFLYFPPVHTSPVNCVACSPTDESLFISCGQVRYWYTAHVSQSGNKLPTTQLWMFTRTNWLKMTAINRTKSSWPFRIVFFFVFLLSGWTCPAVGQEEAKQTCN